MEDYYQDVFDKTHKTRSKRRHLQSLTNNEFEKCVQTKDPIKNPGFFDIEKVFTDYISNHKKNRFLTR